MRIPRLLEVLGRVGRQQGRAAPGAAVSADAAPARGSVQMSAPRSAATARHYVEDVRVCAGGLVDPDGKPPGFQVPPRPPGSDRAASRASSRPQASAMPGRERISVSTRVEGGDRPLRRPPAPRPAASKR